MAKKLTRRSFLRGSGGLVVGIPFLESLRSEKAFAQQAFPNRFITTYYGSTTGNARYSSPDNYGPLNQPLKLAFAPLQDYVSKLSFISNLDFPITNVPPTEPGPPGSARNKQHAGVESPLFSGMAAMERVAPVIRGTTVDQIAADFLGSGSQNKSLQLRVQAASYNGRTGARAQGTSTSVRAENGRLNELPMIESPKRLYDMLFAAGGTTTNPTTQTLAKNKSALDFVLEDANRLIASVSANDRQLLEDHFEKIREFERSLSSGGSGGGGMQPSTLLLNNPGPDPQVNSYSFGGWADETKRGEAMADMIAYALSTDITRVVAWAFTHFQCWLNSQMTGGSATPSGSNGVPEIHNDSHNSSAEQIAKNCAWATGLLARLLGNLESVQEGTGTLLDHTFISFVTAESKNAHGKTNYTYAVAGMGDRINLGQHINGNKAHPALVHLDGLRAIGLNTNRLGEVSGSLPGLLKV